MRRELIPGFLGMYAAETGALPLNQVIHFYRYNDYAHRAEVRRSISGELCSMIR